MQRILNVLLVDREGPRREAAMALLATIPSGSAVRTQTRSAADAAAALTLLGRSVPVDVILIPSGRPEEAGPAVARALRDRPEGAKIPIIGLLCEAGPSARAYCLGAGMHDTVDLAQGPAPLAQALDRWTRPRPPLPADSDTLQVTSAMESLDTDELAYRTLLDGFVAKYARADEEISRAFAASDWDSARRVAHSVRGMAGMIGARDLWEKCGLLEDLAREKKAEGFAPALESAGRALKSLLALLGAP